jgi:outer membrane protein TolC
VARNRYLIGRIDITNLLIAQNERDSARRSYIQALRNYWLGVYNLRRLTLYDFETQSRIRHD